MSDESSEESLEKSITNAYDDVTELVYEIGYTITNIINGFSGLRFTILRARPNKTPELTAFLTAIDEAYRDYKAVDKILARSKNSINSKTHSPQHEVAILKGLWMGLEDQLNSGKIKVVKATIHMMTSELERVKEIQKLVAHFYIGATEEMVDFQYVTLLENFKDYLDNWTATSELFIRLMPDRLEPMSFFENANALYRFLSAFFENIVIEGDGRSFIMKKLHDLVCEFVKMGSIGVQHFLQLKNNKPRLAWMKKALGWDGVSIPSKKVMEKVNLVKQFKIDPSKMGKRSADLGNAFFRGRGGDFYPFYNDVLLLDAFMKHLLKTAKSTYAQMRRTIFHILNLTFPPEEMMQKADQALLELNIFFSECLEVPGFCKKIIKYARRCSQYVIEDFISESVKEEVYHVVMGMGEPYVNACKEVVRRIVHDDYATSKAMMHNAMVEFVVNLSSKIAETGMHPLHLTWTYILFREAMSVYRGIMFQLQDIGVPNRSLTDKDHMLICQNIHMAKVHLISCFNKCYESLNNIRGRSRPTNWGFVFHRLPVTNNLREEIINTIQVPFRKGPTTYRMILPPAAKIEYILMKVIDLKNLYVPEQDIVSADVFKTMLKNARHLQEREF